MDASRGLIIGIIAVYHACQELLRLGIRDEPAANAIFPTISIGMGLFFILAGVNSRKYLHGTWGFAWRRRLGPLLWLLAVWVVIYWLLNTFVFSSYPISLHEAALSLLYGFVTPAWGLWFLWSLTVYFLTSKLLIELPSLFVLLPAGTLALIGLCTSDYHLRKYGLSWFADSYNWRSALSFFFFFYCGHRYASSVLKFANLSLSATLVIASALGYLAGKFDGVIHSIVVNGPLHVVALVAGLAVAVSYGRILASVSLIRTLGAATLPIYLLHTLLITALIRIPSLRTFFLHRSDSLTPVAIGLVSVIVSLLLARLAKPLKVTWLFKPPATLIELHDGIIDEIAARLPGDRNNVNLSR